MTMKVRAQNTPPEHFIPYGRQQLDESDIQAVLDVLQSDYLTTGPRIRFFEEAVADFTGAGHAVAVANGTAALHAVMHAMGIGPGDEVILSPMTFAASANAVVYQKGVPVFVDIDPATLLMDPEKVAEQISPRTKAILAVDYAGQPCDYDALQTLARQHGLFLIADACHALGAEYKGRKVGTLADATVFSFHPVKHITTGEGGMIVTDHPDLAEKLRRFRNHGINTDHTQRAQSGTWYYEMTDLGYNYRLTDIQCALGISQLKRLPEFLQIRQTIAAAYGLGFADNPAIQALLVQPHVRHAYHLYVVRIDFQSSGLDRAELFTLLRGQGIGANVHYIPVHLHPYYRKTFGTAPGLCPLAEEAYQSILSLPMHAAMGARDTIHVIATLNELTAMARVFPAPAKDQSLTIPSHL